MCWPSPHSLLTAQSTARHPSGGRKGTEAALWEKWQATLIHRARGPIQSGHGLGCSQEVRGPWSLGVSDSQGRKALSTQDGLHVRAHEDSWGWPWHAHVTAGGHCPGAELSPVLRGTPASRGSKQILENAAEKIPGARMGRPGALHRAAPCTPGPRRLHGPGHLRGRTRMADGGGLAPEEALGPSSPLFLKLQQP